MVLLLLSNYTLKQVNSFIPVTLQSLIDLFVLHFQEPLRDVYIAAVVCLWWDDFREKLKATCVLLGKCLSYLNDLKLLYNIDIKLSLKGQVVIKRWLDTTEDGIPSLSMEQIPIPSLGPQMGCVRWH